MLLFEVYSWNLKFIWSLICYDLSALSSLSLFMDPKKKKNRRKKAENVEHPVNSPLNQYGD